MTANGTNRANRRGAAAVELAVLLPFIGLMFAAALDFARVFATTQALENAAYAGALYASGTAWAPGAPTGSADAAKKAAVAEGPALSPALQAGNVTVTVAGGNATVSVDYDFPLITAVLGQSTVHLKRTVTLKVAPRPGD